MSFMWASGEIGVLDWVITVVFAVMCVALTLATLRLLLGPTLADRVVALELMASVTVGIIAVYTISSEVSDFLDVAVVLALTAFLAAVGFARYLEKRGRGDD